MKFGFLQDKVKKERECDTKLIATEIEFSHLTSQKKSSFMVQFVIMVIVIMLNLGYN